MKRSSGNNVGGRGSQTERRDSDEIRDARARVQRAEEALVLARGVMQSALAEYRDANRALAKIARPRRAARPGGLVWTPEDGQSHTYITACGRYRVWRQEHVRNEAPLYAAERVSEATPHFVASGKILLGGRIKSGPEKGDFPVGLLREAKQSCQRHADGADGEEKRGE